MVACDRLSGTVIAYGHWGRPVLVFPAEAGRAPLDSMTELALTELTPTVLTVLAASAAVFTLAVLSAVAGFGGGVLLLPVFTVLFGLRVAVRVVAG